MKYFWINGLALLFCFYSFGQTHNDGKPYNYQQSLKNECTDTNKTSTIILPMPETKILEKNPSAGGYFRYGKVIDVSFNCNNSGEWSKLKNGDRVWKITIHCPHAKSVNLSYDKLWIPEGGIIRLYNKSGKRVPGELTTKNNRGSKEKPSGYSSKLIFSEEITIEYYEPREVMNEGVISISKVVYGYKDIRLLRGATTQNSDTLCAVNVNCSPEGDDWQDKKTSVAMVLTNGGAFSGSLLNNTRKDGTPYFLTANHCINNGVGNNYDAIDNPDASDFIFWWVYEWSDCTETEYSYVQTIGAKVMANNSLTDFALLRLNETPYDLSPQLPVFFNGWDLRPPYSGNVCIHHPKNNPKKIAIDSKCPTTANKYFWKVRWDETNHGFSIIYRGSSGAPLYNIFRNKRVVGQLKGAPNFSYVTQTANFGKFHISWDKGPNPARRLKEWLDPDNSGVEGIDGTFCSNENIRYLQNIHISSDENIFGCSLYIANLKISNGANAIFHAAYDVVITGEFEIERGATLNIGPGF